MTPYIVVSGYVMLTQGIVHAFFHLVHYIHAGFSGITLQKHHIKAIEIFLLSIELRPVENAF